MRPKYIMALAALTVALMMGSALVPLASDSGYVTESAPVLYSSTEGDASAIGTSSLAIGGGSVDMSSILMLLDSMDMSSSFSAYVKSTLVPVANDTDYTKMVKWSGSNVSDASVVGLYDNAAASLDGDVIIGTGATLVLFPVLSAVTDYTFTVSSVGPSAKVCLKDGSYLDILGLKFMVVAEKIDYTINILEIGGTVKVESKILDGKFSAYVELGAKSEMEFIAAKLVNTTEIAQTASNAAVKIDTAGITKDRNSVAFSGIAVKVDSKIDSDGMKLNLSVTISGDSISAATTVTGDRSKIQFEYGAASAEAKVTVKDSGTETVVVELSGCSVPAGKLSLDMKIEKKTVDSKTKLASDIILAESVNDSTAKLKVGTISMPYGKIVGIEGAMDTAELRIISDPSVKKTVVSFDVSGEMNGYIESIEIAQIGMKGLGKASAPIATMAGCSFSVTDLSLYVDVSNGGMNVTGSVKSMTLAIDSLSVNALLTAGTATAPALSLDAVSLSISDLAVEYKQTKESVTYKATLGSLSLGGKVTMISLMPYPVSLELSASDLYVENDGESLKASLDKIYAKISIRYDGADRSIIADVKDVEVEQTSKKVREDTVTTLTVKIGEVSASCNVPFSTMGLGTIAIDLNIDISASAENVTVVSDSDAGLTVTGDSVSIGSKTPLSFAPYVEEIKLKAEGFSIEGMALTADKVSGSLKNFGEKEQSFSIEPKGNKDPKLIFEMTTGYAIKIAEGRAEFNGGYLPINLIVGKDAVFVADGLSANNFIIEKGAIMSGIVALDTKEYICDGPRSITYDGLNLVTLRPLEDKKLASAGYKMLFDIGTLGGGKLIACEGTAIPDYKAEYGTKWVTSEDKMTATFDTGNDATFCFETESNTYKFAYEGEDPVDVKYGEEVTLKLLPEKSGMVGLGWDDGTGNIYAASTQYRMPAGDVTLKAKYADAAPKETVKDNVVEIASDAGSAVIVSSDSIKKVTEGSILKIVVKGAEIQMSDRTLDGLKTEYGADNMSLTLSVNKATDVKDDLIKNIVGNNMLYNIELLDNDGQKFSYSNGETFQVSLDVSVSGKVDYFKISYLSDDYKVHKVGVTGFSQSDDNNCNVSFECNHFSDYIIEPVYKSTDWTTVTILIVLVVIVVALVFFAAVRVSKASKY